MAESVGGGSAREQRRQVWRVSSPVLLDAWRWLISWLTFLLQIVRGTPSAAFMLLSYVGFGQSLVLPASASSPPNHSFKRLPVNEVSLQGTEKSSSEVGNPHIEKLTVVLDLDETLVCAYETSSLLPNVRTRAIEAGLKWFEIECVSEKKEIDGRKKINHVIVFERPGLQEFLTQLGEFAHLVLFTAGLEGYARPLADKIYLEGRFCMRLYRPSTVSTEHVKDLLLVSKDMRRIVIVDNNPYSFLLQPLTAIPCTPFSASQTYDHQCSVDLDFVHLVDVLLPFMKKLSYEKDVRPVLYERFHMPEWFQTHGIPSSVETKLYTATIYNIPMMLPQFNLEIARLLK